MKRRAYLVILATIAVARAVPVFSAGATALVGATIVDLSNFGRSDRDLADAVVLIRDGRIDALGRRGEIAIPADSRVVDLSGRYLVPGLIDGFAGLNSQAQANAYLYLGVTSIVGVGDDRRGELLRTADPSPRIFPLSSVGFEGDETEAGSRVFDEAGALADVDRLARQGTRVLLLLYPLPPDRTAAIVRRAKASGLATIGELGRTSYEDALRAGVQAFVHTSRYSLPLADRIVREAVAARPFGPPKVDYYRWLETRTGDEPETRAWAKRLGTSGAGLIPTLALEYLDLPGHENPWREPVAKILDPAGIHLPADPATGERRHRPDSGPDAFPADLSRALFALERRYTSAGAHHLAGSGTSAFGTMPGISLHHELGLLVAVGASPREALAAATSNYGAIFGWKEIGSIVPGARADLLVLDADPTKDVRNLHRIDAVWLAGAPVDREALLRK